MSPRNQLLVDISFKTFVLSSPCIAGGRSDEGVDKHQEESRSTSESGTCARAQNHGAEAETKGKKL